MTLRRRQGHATEIRNRTAAGNFPTSTGRASGMPHMMMGFNAWNSYSRPISPTPGSDSTTTTAAYLPMDTNAEPTFQGYSIGKWIDEDGDGVYDVLEVET